MPSSCGYTWSSELDNLIRAESAAQGVPLDLSYAIIGAESGFDPAATNISAIEESYGLLQLNRRGGQGSGYSPQQLLDPQTNLRIGLPPIRHAFEAAWTAGIEPFELIYLVATRSGHPGPVARNDARIYKIANNWACFYGVAGFSLEGPSPAPGTVGVPSRSLAAFVGLFLGTITVVSRSIVIQAVYNHRQPRL